MDFSEEMRRQWENDGMHRRRRGSSICLERRREGVRWGNWRMGSCLPWGWPVTCSKRNNQLGPEQLLSWAVRLMGSGPLQDPHENLLEDLDGAATSAPNLSPRTTSS